MIPAIGSRWKFRCLPDAERIVELVIDKPYGRYVLYTDAWKGEEKGLEIRSIEVWNTNVKDGVIVET